MKNSAEYIKNLLSGITDEDYSAGKTMLSVDTAGRLMIDGFDKIEDYTRQNIKVVSAGRTISIQGKNLTITGCDKKTIYLTGGITAINLE